MDWLHRTKCAFWYRGSHDFHFPFWLVLFEAMRTGGNQANLAGNSLVVGFGGVFILIGPSELTGAENSFDTFGVILLLLAPLFWSMGSIYARGADMPRSTLLSTGMQMLTGAVALFVVSVVKGELSGFSFGLVSMRSWLALAYLVTFGSLIGFVSFGWLLHNAPVSLTSTYAYVNPVVAVFLGYLFADEVLNGRILVATAIIIGSVMPSIARDRPRSRQNCCRPSPTHRTEPRRSDGD
jgi:drug/metabolite transporter (DMT)-like permease